MAMTMSKNLMSFVSTKLKKYKEAKIAALVLEMLQQNKNQLKIKEDLLKVNYGRSSKTRT